MKMFEVLSAVLGMVITGRDGNAVTGMGEKVGKSQLKREIRKLLETYGDSLRKDYADMYDFLESIMFGESGKAWEIVVWDALQYRDEVLARYMNDYPAPLPTIIRKMPVDANGIPLFPDELPGDFVEKEFH